jgi:prefoldin alpha subunit
MSKKEEKYLELRQLDEEIKTLNTHLEKVDDQITELNSSKTVINKFAELKKNDELRVPIASGIYVKAKLEDVNQLLVNVGSGVSVEKKHKEVTKILDSQIVELSQYRVNLVEQMKGLITKVEKIQKEFS